MNKMNFKFILCFASMLLIFSSMAFGQQDTGQINGTVRDQNDAAIAGATVKVTNTSTNVQRSTTTNSDGYYVAIGLIPGSYEIEVSAQGFSTLKSSATVSIGGVTTSNVKLGIAATVNVVDVPGTGGIAEVNTSDQSQSTIVTPRMIEGLPTLDRNPYDLVTLSGNISTGGDLTARGAGVAINGQRAASTGILLDGAENAATFTQTISQSIPADAMSEFRVLTSTFSAEYGRASGGIVNVGTKSGGNKLTGSVFGYNRNSRLASAGFDSNARGFKKAVFNRNQFGGTVSGPIKKDKLFFFDSIELTRIRSTKTQVAWIPTTSFLSSAAANTQSFFSTYGTLAATPNGVVSADGRFRQVTYNAPTDAGGGTPTNDWNNVARVDWNLSDKTNMFFSYKAFSQKFLPGTGDNSPWAGYSFNTKAFNQNFQVSGTHTFTSNLLFDGKVTYRHAKSELALGAKSPNTPTLYWTDQTLPRLGGVCIAFPGYLPCFPGSGFPSPETEQLWDVKPNMTWIKGNHNVRFGGQYIHLKDDNLFGAYQNASEGLSVSSNAQAAANFLSGTLARFQVAVDPQGKFPGSTVTLPVKAPNFRRTNVYNEFALYAQDSWRVTPTFTVIAGLRYEYFGPQKSKEGQDANFYFGSGSNIFQRIRSGKADLASANGGLWKADKNNFGPRVGFAWDIFGDGKTSLRGGYGIGYERNFGNVTFNVIQNPPFYAVLSVPGVVTNDNFGPLAGSSGTATLPRSSLRAVDPDIQTAFAHQWGLTFERQVSRNTVARFEHSGSAGRKLYSIANINRLGTGTFYLGSAATTGCNGLASTDRLNCQYSNINFRGSDGTSNYYAFTPALESTDLFGTGMILTAKYTYAVNKDNLSSTFSESGNNFNLGYVDPFNPMLDYGYADVDQRHRFVGSLTYAIPFRSDNSIARHILSGWNYGATFAIASGTPFTIFDVNSCNVTTCWRILNGGQIQFNKANSVQSSAGPNLSDYIVLSNVPVPAGDILGNNEVGPIPSNMSRRNSFRAPGGWNADMSLYKDFSVTERYKLQFRVESTNVFNHANTFVDGANAFIFDGGSPDGLSNGGVIQTLKGGVRTVQISAKLFF